MKKNLPILTGIRFFAAFYVFIFHVDLRKSLDFLGNTISSVVSQGAVGVNVFFILSGFILFYNYHDKQVNFLEFILKRLAKIYPVYIAGFLISLLIVIILGIKVDYFFEILMMNLLMVQSYFPKFSMEWYGSGSWSISTEFFFYLCFPVLLRYILKQSKKQVVLIGILCYLCSTLPGVLFNFKMMSFLASYTFPPSRVWEFIIGMLTALLVGKFNVKTNNVQIFIVVILSALFFFFFGKNLEGYVIQNIIVIPLMVIALISTTTMNKCALGFLGNKFFEYLGKISYSFYIVQLPIMIYLDARNNLNAYSSLQSLIVIFVANLLGAMFLYHLIELPFHKFFNKKIKQSFYKIENGYEND